MRCVEPCVLLVLPDVLCHLVTSHSYNPPNVSVPQGCLYFCIRSMGSRSGNYGAGCRDILSVDHRQKYIDWKKNFGLFRLLWSCSKDQDSQKLFSIQGFTSKTSSAIATIYECKYRCDVTKTDTNICMPKPGPREPTRKGTWKEFKSSLAETVNLCCGSSQIFSAR